MISSKWEHNGTSLQTCDVCVTVKGMIDIITGAHATTLQPHDNCVTVKGMIKIVTTGGQRHVTTAV